MLLKALAASKPAGHILELGTGTGLATAWLLSGMDSASTLTSIDTDPAIQAVAQQALGGDSRLTLLLSDGVEYLHAQKPQSCDLVFADAMAGKYEDLDNALAVVRSEDFT